jgi:biotin synthase
MSDEMHALCFFAGANSIHFGEEKLFTTSNPSVEKDQAIIKKLGMKVLRQEQLEAIHASE